MNQTNETNPKNQTNASPPPPYYPYPIYPEEDEIDLIELWKILWRGKWVIIAFTFICSVLSVAYALHLTPIYKAEVVLSPVQEGGGGRGISALAAQYGGLAALAGINLGSGSSSVENNIAILKSREFIYRFIEDNDLMPILFAEMWDKEKKAWLSTQLDETPTLWRAYQAFTDGILNVSQDRKTGLIRLSISWKDPETSAKWANDLVARINGHIRAKAIHEAQKSIDYLEKEIAKTSDISMQEVLYRLIEKQTQTITLSQAREEYAFEVIDPAVIPEFRDRPNRRMIVIVGSGAGALVAMIMVFLFATIKKARNKSEEKN